MQYIRGMRKGLFSSLLLASLVSVASAQQTTPTPAPGQVQTPKSGLPAVAPQPATKDVPVPTDEENKILKIQRQFQAISLNETSRQKQAEAEEATLRQKYAEQMNQVSEQLNGEVAKARKYLKLPDNTPFDQAKLAFQVPVK